MAKRDRLALSAYQSVETYRDASGSLPMRESLDSWLASLADMDAARQKPSPKEGLSDELLATGFGPEVHEEEDPTANTKMIT